ncbi:MAG: CapA family protein [Deltaproteobacteria bacterium]|nr:CapA family protein [Deltaproteobacteria bacterium]
MGAPVRLFLCGDVMTGRGIDQILPHPSRPGIYEPWVRDARDYVALAEEVNGPIPRPVDFDYVWGDALQELEARRPDARIINLETSVTRSEAYWPRKGINYRMHPANTPCLAAARPDCASLANNHVLDWGYEGLAETLETLRAAGLRTAGAGRDAEEARAPAVLEVAGKGRVLVFAFGSPTSGVPEAWAAGKGRSGVSFLPGLSGPSLRRIAAQVEAVKQPGDLVVVSLHWGSNWGYDIPDAHREFAERLTEEASVDLVHGHSSHHPRPIEVHRGKLILYGCGDFINDYEGIEGYEAFRGDLSLMYFADVEVSTGRLLSLRMAPMRMRRFRLEHPGPEDVAWLAEVLTREGRPFRTSVAASGEELVLDWF